MRERILVVSVVAVAVGGMSGCARDRGEEPAPPAAVATVSTEGAPPLPSDSPEGLANQVIATAVAATQTALAEPPSEGAATPAPEETGQTEPISFVIEATDEISFMNIRAGTSIETTKIGQFDNGATFEGTPTGIFDPDGHLWLQIEIDPSMLTEEQLQGLEVDPETGKVRAYVLQLDIVKKVEGEVTTEPTPEGEIVAKDDIQLGMYTYNDPDKEGVFMYQIMPRDGADNTATASINSGETFEIQQVTDFTYEGYIVVRVKNQGGDIGWMAYIANNITPLTALQKEISDQPTSDSQGSREIDGKTFVLPLSGGVVIPGKEWGTPADYTASGKIEGVGLTVFSDQEVPVLSISSGKVVYIGPLFSDARGASAVIVDHGDGLYSTYAHNERAVVNVGDEVTTGQQIAVMGSDGYTFATNGELFLQIVQLSDEAVLLGNTTSGWDWRDPYKGAEIVNPGNYIPLS